MADDDTPMIPKARLDAEIEKRKAAESRASTLHEQLTEAKALAASATKEVAGLKAQVDGIPELQAQIQTLRSDLDRTRTEGAAHTAMLESGVDDGSVRDYALHQFAKATAEAGDKAPEFSAWWEGQVAKPSAVLKPFLERTTTPPAGDGAGAGDGAPAAGAAAGDAATKAAEAAKAAAGADAGARPNPPTPSPWSPGAVSNMSRDEFKAQRETLVKGLSVANL